MDTFSFALLVDAALKGTLVLLAAGGLTLILRRGSAARRHLVWQMSVLAILSLPLIKAFSPMQLAILPELRSAITVAPAAPADVFAPAVETPENAGAITTAAPPSTTTSSPTTSSPNPFSTSADAAGSTPLVLRALRWFGYAWIIVAAALLMRLALGFVLVRWFALRAYPLYEEGWSELNAELSALVGLRRDVQLFASPHIATPMTWGIVRPVIMLPSAAEDWSAERRRVVMLHELAHVRRRDSLTHMFSQIACAVYWFHPLVWKANARMRAEAERACDDLVLAAGTKASVYAEHLLDLIRTIGNMRTPALALPMAQRSTFEGRLLAILEPHIDRTTPRPLSIAGMVVVVGLVIFPLAGLTTASAISTETGSVKMGDGPDAKTTSEFAFKSDTSPKSKSKSNSNTNTNSNTNSNTNTNTNTNSNQEKSVRYAVAPLMRALSDRDAGVRLEAAQSLGQMEDTAAVAALARALRNDADASVRKMAAWALGNIESSDAVPALVHALRNDRDLEVRRTSVWALGQIEDASAVEALSEALKSGDVEMRQQAAWALGEIEDASAVSALAAALRDSDAEVRKQSVWALGQIESPAAVAPLSAFVNDSNIEVRKQVAWALGQIEDADAVPALSRMVREDKDARVRETAAWALGQIESSTALPALFVALKDGSADVRSHAAWALGQIEDPAAAAPLRAAMKDPDADVRQAVLNALISLGDDMGYEALAEMLKDADPEVRRAAAAAMGGKRGGYPDPRPMPMPQPRPMPQPNR